MHIIYHSQAHLDNILLNCSLNFGVWFSSIIVDSSIPSLTCNRSLLFPQNRSRKGDISSNISAFSTIFFFEVRNIYTNSCYRKYECLFAAYLP